ncbi:hypothetical protein A3765_18275, partial [Oleiphilus sp. HI0130]
MTNTASEPNASLCIKSERAALTTKVAYFVLLAALAFSSFVPGPPEGVSIFLVLGVKFIPLLIVLPGLLLNKLRSYVWLCFIVLFYFTRAFVDAYMRDESVWVDSFITLTTIVVFMAAMYFVKWQKMLG